MQFEAHGEGEVYWQNNYLFVEPSGGFNQTGAKLFHEHIMAVAEQHPAAIWYRFDVVRNPETLGPPEAKANMIFNFQHSRSLGCRFVSIVGGNIAMRETLLSACRAAQIEARYFSSVEEAVRFVASVQA